MNIQLNDIVEIRGTVATGDQGWVVGLSEDGETATVQWKGLSTNESATRGEVPISQLKPVRRSARWIKKLDRGQHVVLKFTTRSEPMFDEQVFLELSEDGETAKFCAVNPDGANTYVWEAYRFNGYWAYGSSAQRVGIA